MLKDTKSLGNSKASACKSRGFVHKKKKVRFLTHLRTVRGERRGARFGAYVSSFTLRRIRFGGFAIRRGKYKGLCPDKKIPICILQRKDELATDTAEEVFSGLEILIFGLVGFQIRPNVTA